MWSCSANSWHWKADKEIYISNFNDILAVAITLCVCVRVWGGGVGGGNYLFLLIWLVAVQHMLCVCVCVLFFLCPPSCPTLPLSCIKLVSLIKRARVSLAAMAMGWHDVSVSVPASDARTKCLGSRCWQGRGGSVPSGPELRPRRRLALCSCSCG